MLPPTRLIGALVTVLLCSTVSRICCQEIKCYHPAVPPNTRVTLSTPGLTPGTTAVYQCDEGYETFGNTTLVCSPTGQWQGEIPFCGINVAYRKPANQSTTAKGGNAIHANDGDRTTNHNEKMCTETYKEASPWWQVDLLRPYPIKVIRVTTRGCCGQQPLQDLEIRIGNNSHQLQKNPLCAWFPGTLEEGVTKTFTCARTLIGQHVFVQLGVEGTLSLCEVEVFSSDELPVHHCQSSKNLENAALATFEKKCYFFEVNKGSTFKTARSTCQSINSDLIHNLTTLDMTFLRAQLDRWKPKLKTQLVWLGANKDPGVIARTWKWVNGEAVQRPTWGRDQPNNYNGEQNCVVLDGGRDWLWNDVGCSLDYLHWICQYGPLNCGSPDKNVNTTIKGTDFSVSSKIEYSCPPGNVLLGDKVRSCEKTAAWTGIAPTCRYVDCGPPSKLENGTVSLVNESTTYGAKLLYTCYENYTLVGEEIQVCKKDGKWSGTVPKCLFSICQEPPSVHGGMINVSGYKVGDSATYNCLTGYVMFGMEKLRCGLGGEWVGKPPFCKYVDCGFPTDIEYGKYDLKNGTTIVGSIVEYTCIDDYWLDGERLQRCTREGKWTADAPVCQLITCDEPEVPPGSYVIGYDFNVHSKIEYHCETGHLLVGKSSHVCEKTGEWSDSVPVCEFIDCGKVPPLSNGNVEYINGTTYLKSEIRYTCNKNFKLIGTPKRICQENKQWSEDTPKCEEIRCPEPVIPQHGVISVTGNDRLYGRTLIKTAESSHTGATSYKVGALLKYRCGRGYKVVGEALSTCENTGSWSGNVPQCIYVDCGEPEKLQHGHVVLPTNATFYGVLALYSCIENYELEGVSRRLCQENGTWSSDAPKCREIQCKEPKANKGVLYKLESRSIGGTVKYHCPKGFLIQGNSTRTCLKSGSWSGIAPNCKPRNCSYPKDIENGRIIVINGTTYNSAIEYHCIPNFVREGPYLRKCMENGEWSGDEPACKIATNETRDTSQIGTGIGIGAGVLVFLLVLLGAIYFKLRKPVAVKNTENVEEAERKEDKSAAVMSYATLSDRNGNGHANLYENIREENLYDAPYEERRRRRDSGVYEPEPGAGNDNFITINGITVR